MAREVMTVLVASSLTACPTDPGSSSSDQGSLSGDASSTAAVATFSTTTGDELGDTSGSAGPSTSAPADTSTGGEGNGCNVANPCDAGGFCVAPYADNDRGDFACVENCVEPGDENSWCFDAAACCDPTASCTERGYCVAPGGSDGSSSDAGTGGSGSSG